MLAVVAANQDQPDAVYSNLKDAVAACKDPEMMKAHAKKDLNFAKQFETAEFKAIVE
jgi:hypothetical protein